MKKVIFLVLAIIATLLLLIIPNNKGSKTIKNEEVNKNTVSDPKYSTIDPSSIWVIVNKKLPLPKNYTPKDLVQPNVSLTNEDKNEEKQLKKIASEAAGKMFADTEKQGFKLTMASGYRSADLQKFYYDSYVAKDGQEAADRYSARPGTSEHQTGLALDISRSDRKCYLEICFADTAEGKWLASNAHKYGFILRYIKNKENITGYQYEPWHFRYVGTDLAGKLFQTGQTMEEYFKL